MLDTVVREKLETLGPTKSSKFFINPKTNRPVTKKTIDGWLNNIHGVPLWAVDLAYQASDKDITTPKSQVLDLEWEGKKLIIAMCCYKHTNPNTMFSVFALQDLHQGKIGLDMINQTLIVEARNRLATRFMKTNAEWLLFLDDDMVFPCGKAGVYAERWGANVPEPYASMDVISRLIGHGVPLVGGLYFGRHEHSNAQYAEAFNNEKENKYAHKAPYDEIRATRWVATGCMLIHRSVFEAIEEKFPEVVYDDNPAKTNGYFSPIEANCGEDMSFCTRAHDAGIQPYVDMGCICGHLGYRMYWHHNSL